MVGPAPPALGEGLDLHEEDVIERDEPAEGQLFDYAEAGEAEAQACHPESPSVSTRRRWAPR